jgi:predicted DNA binding CopG/RHH family protein
MTKNKNIHIRVSAAEHAAIMKTARQQGMTVSAYILHRLGVKK